MARLGEDRPTTDLLILIIAGTICAAILLGIVGVFVVEVANPNTDLAKLAGNLNDVISTLVGLLAGWLAGRTERTRVRRGREDDE
jgi:hypothetical protein